MDENTYKPLLSTFLPFCRQALHDSLPCEEEAPMVVPIEGSRPSPILFYPLKYIYIYILDKKYPS